MSLTDRPVAATATGAGSLSHFSLRFTRRHLQIALGLFWLLDGLLQLQPYMLGTDFANQVIAPTASGQPHWVSAPVLWGARLIAAHPVAWDVPFALIQLLIGLGLLFPRTAKLALAVSVPWGLGVWFLGEGLSGMASGHASLLTGAPGSVLVYVLLALAAWPSRDAGRETPARWLPIAWAVIWVGGAVLQALPAQNTGQDLVSALAGPDPASGWMTSHGTVVVAVLVIVEALIGLGALHRRTRGPAVIAGLVLALAIWVIGQDLGLLFSGQATDPNTAPLLALMAVSILGPGAAPAGATARRMWAWQKTFGSTSPAR
ncbi:MAG: hypothetical protein QOF39_3197 [Frankiales bacterium]|nr:hypothetical protein [Frankiales bacterium]